jgi:hypothetical protein
MIKIKTTTNSARLNKINDKKTRLPNRTENTKIGAFRQPALTLTILVMHEISG